MKSSKKSHSVAHRSKIRYEDEPEEEVVMDDPAPSDEFAYEEPHEPEALVEDSSQPPSDEETKWEDLHARISQQLPDIKTHDNFLYDLAVAVERLLEDKCKDKP